MDKLTMMDDIDEIKPTDFRQMGLDERVLKAIKRLGWENPMLIQEKAIPLVLQGKDVLMRARTGSGKTGAFAIPVIQKILNNKKANKGIQALVMAPTRELSHQIAMHFNQLTVKCSTIIKVVDISPQVELSSQRPLLENSPEIVVATPARALAHLKNKSMTLESLKMLVVDEADLIFSFGYEEDFKQVMTFLPRIYQATLASATLSEDVVTLKKLILHNAVTLKLHEPDLAPLSQLQHYMVNAEEEEKATILYTLLKLSLLIGKTIIFVNTVDKCYKLKMFLQHFGINCCVLNSELPSSVRCHSVSQFNDGTYNVIIASDENCLDDPGKNQEKNKKRKKDKESGVSRGIDFQCVSNVVNFDFPLDINMYIHRAGRTARGNSKGFVLNFINIREKELLNAVEVHIKAGLAESKSIFQKYHIKMEDLEGFRYRAKDAWKASTRIAVREARLAEIKREIFNSEKLKGYFEENPRELRTLRHDKALHSVKLQSHLKDVPDYLIPESLKPIVQVVGRPRNVNSGKIVKRRIARTNAKARHQARQNDLLSCTKRDSLGNFDTTMKKFNTKSLARKK